jgi:hypothetical protein
METNHCRTATNGPLGRHSGCSPISTAVAGNPDPPEIDGAEESMFAVAAKSIDEAWLAAWLRERIRLASSATELVTNEAGLVGSERTGRHYPDPRTQQPR